MYSNRNKKQRPYRVRKNSIKDDLIDKQILALHRAMVEKVLANIELIDELKARWDAKRKAGEIGYSEYITWYSLFELAHQPDVFRDGVLENSTQMRRLRRKTPFVNILTEEEREQALMADAAGKINSISYLLN